MLGWLPFGRPFSVGARQFVILVDSILESYINVIDVSWPIHEYYEWW